MSTVMMALSVATVQISAWTPGPPLLRPVAKPRPPVFGHAGAIAGNTIVYLDGVRVDRGSRWSAGCVPANE